MEFSFNVSFGVFCFFNYQNIQQLVVNMGQCEFHLYHSYIMNSRICSSECSPWFTLVSRYKSEYLHECPIEL